MKRLSYAKLNRVLCRCEEIAAEPGMSSTVTNVYTKVLKSEAERYMAAYDAIAETESAAKENRVEARAALAKLEGPYKGARSSVLAINPSKVLPATLAVQPTDTDALYAIKTLIKVIQGYAGEQWADDLLSSELGAGSTKAMSALSASILANKEAAKAVDERGAAFETAYVGYLAFKRVVRDTLGRSSKQYQRIHLRAKAGAEAEAEVEGEAAPLVEPVKDAVKQIPARAEAGTGAGAEAGTGAGAEAGTGAGAGAGAGAGTEASAEAA